MTPPDDRADDDSEIESYTQLQPVFWWARKAVTIVATILFGTFVWLQWRNYLTNTDFLDSIDKSLIIKVALGIYYFSWVYACRFDLKVQEDVYLKDPNKGTLPRSFFWLTPLFLVGGGALLWAADHDVYYLAIFMSVFFVIDSVTWVALRNWAVPIAEATKKHFERNPNRYFYAERIDVVRNLLCGNYQIYRHIVLFALLVGFDAIALFEQPRAEVAAIVHRLDSGIPVGSIIYLMPALSLLVYVVVCEGSMWFMRARAKLALHIIDRLYRKYRLIPREVAPP